MTTYKLQLTEDEWLAALRGGNGVAVALHESLNAQQPELYHRLVERIQADHEASRKAAQEQAEAEAKAKAAQATNEPPATAPATVEDAGPKAPVRKSGKQSDKP